jgi:hypothetical protein
MKKKGIKMGRERKKKDTWEDGMFMKSTKNSENLVQAAWHDVVRQEKAR